MKKSSKLIESKKTGMERETRVLLEEMYSDIKRIAEAHSTTNNKIDRLETAVADLMPLKSEVKVLSVAVTQISGDMKKLDAKVNVLDNKVSVLDNKVSVLDNKVSLLDNKVDAIDRGLKAVANKVDENLSNHEKRIKKIEEKVFV